MLMVVVLSVLALHKNRLAEAHMMNNGDKSWYCYQDTYDEENSESQLTQTSTDINIRKEKRNSHLTVKKRRGGVDIFNTPEILRY
jgi:hypothetical protein